MVRVRVRVGVRADINLKHRLFLLTYVPVTSPAHRRGGRCQQLVETGTDPRSVLVGAHHAPPPCSCIHNKGVVQCPRGASKRHQLDAAGVRKST
jgi:hypothetical protein